MIIGVSGCTTPLLPFSDAVHQTILFEKKVNKLVYKILAKITSMRAKGPSASAQYISSKSQAPMLQLIYSTNFHIPSIQHTHIVTKHVT